MFQSSGWMALENNCLICVVARRSFGRDTFNTLGSMLSILKRKFHYWFFFFWINWLFINHTKLIKQHSSRLLLQIYIHFKLWLLWFYLKVHYQKYVIHISASITNKSFNVWNVNNSYVIDKALSIKENCVCNLVKGFLCIWPFKLISSFGLPM